MKKKLLIFASLAFFTLTGHSQTVTDFDGNTYNTVTIGTQVWMKENLKAIHYRNGAAIENVTDVSAWVNLSTGAYCDYSNTVSNSTTYGRLYNWFAVNNSNKLCPAGWHMPTNTEWTTLTTFLGDTNAAGGKMKETGTSHWQTPNTGATNSNGFLGLPGGYRDYFGVFYAKGDNGRWWSATEVGGLFVSKAWSRVLNYNNAIINSYREYENDGLSIRCIKDNNTGIEDINYFENIDIYPNPAKDFITIENTVSAPNTIISIYNVEGQMLLQQTLKQTKAEINISFLKKGLYIVKIEGSSLNKVGKFIKE